MVYREFGDWFYQRAGLGDVDRDIFARFSPAWR